MHGDCLKLMDTLTEKSVDLILCDLPYGITACSWDTPIPFRELWKAYNRVLKDDGIVALFGSQPFTSKLVLSNQEDFRYELIWVKNNGSNFQLSNCQPLKYHESICIFYKDLVQTVFSDIMQDCMKTQNKSQRDLQGLFLSKNGNMTGWVSNKLCGKQIPTAEQWHKICEVFNIPDEYEVLLTKLKHHTYNVDTTDTYKQQSNLGKSGTLGHLTTKQSHYIQTKTGFPTSVLYFDRVQNGLHPTQKPVDLLEFLIKTYTNKGDIVMDNCMGSGSTGVACVNLDRNFIGIELDDNYFEVAKRRIEDAMQARDMKLW